jgi:hypothetical protein
VAVVFIPVRQRFLAGRRFGSLTSPRVCGVIFTRLPGPVVVAVVSPAASPEVAVSPVVVAVSPPVVVGVPVLEADRRSQVVLPGSSRPARLVTPRRVAACTGRRAVVVPVVAPRAAA